MKRLSPIMLAGTGSDVGKSLIATGLCRVFLQDGYHPAPFKAQNMALNSYATPDGLEIGRAQAVQAEAAGVACSTDMNPILLKPSGDCTSQVVVNGKPLGNRDAYSYFRKEGKEEFRKIAHAAFDRLSARYNPIVLEGAGSISELNLREVDIVNMPMARYAGAAVILIADIDRGGVFASVYGSIMLQTPEDRQLIKGIIINKFRGDLRLFESGRQMLEKICGVPVLGVVPMARHIDIEEEDSVALKNKHSSISTSKVNIAVILLPRISNFTDFNVLERQPDVNLFYATSASDLDVVDIIIIPGSKNTLEDLQFIRKKGYANKILQARENGKTVVGICGGYQMMGLEISDPDGVEGNIASLPGLGLLPVKTRLTKEKITRQTLFKFLDSPEQCEGYEIHMGQTESEAPLTIDSDGRPDGCIADKHCFGSYIHGILDNQAVIDFLLAPFRKKKPGNAGEDHKSYKERQYDALADLMREYVDIDKIYNILQDND